MYRIEEETIPPVSVFEWIITFCLMLIPVFNIGMLLFWSFAKGVNPNKANWAKAFLVFSLVGICFWFLFLKALFVH